MGGPVSIETRVRSWDVPFAWVGGVAGPSLTSVIRSPIVEKEWLPSSLTLCFLLPSVATPLATPTRRDTVTASLALRKLMLVLG